MSERTRTAPAQANVVLERTYRASIDEIWSLWTTKQGFESWWGPDGFRVEVYEIEPREGGVLHYSMIAATPQMIGAMKEMGQAPSHAVRSRFGRVVRNEHLTLVNMIDFLPGVPPYETTFQVDFTTRGDAVRMVVTLHPAHSPEFTRMTVEGFTSQLGKLDRRFTQT